MFKKIILLVLISFCLFGVALADTELEQIQKAIAEKGLHWTAGKTSVSDLSDQEKRKLCGVIIPPEVKERFDRLNKLPPPPLSEFGKQTRWDWREHNGVTPVKDQGACGSCWDFAAIGALESMVKIYTNGTELDLSEQQALSCNTRGGSCDGGLMEWAYEVFQDYGAITESNMPYQADDEVPCTQNAWQPIVNIEGWTYIPNNVSAIRNALETAPIAVGMSVYSDFFLYTEGCYVHEEGNFNGYHAVLIVGWDDDLCDGQGAWIVKNSWGNGWGESGFFKIRYGECNIGFAGDLIDYNPLFCLKREYPAGEWPYSVFSADLDRDGDKDVAVANVYSDNVSIFKNNGDGTFQTKVDYGVGDGPHSVFCADLDGDSDLDLAVANAYSSTVSILRNNGNGTFQPKVDLIATNGPRSVFCADLDGDSDLDLLVANSGGSCVSVFDNNGDGWVSPVQPSYNISTGQHPYGVFCADLDGDSDPDLVVVCSGPNYVSVFKNNGDGTFEPQPHNYGTGSGPIDVFCADLDGDSDLDLAVANIASDNVSIFKNYGNGTFQTRVDYAAGDAPHSAFCADLDGDSDMDIVVANEQGGPSFSILKNNGDGTFQTKGDYPIEGYWSTSAFCADLDADSDSDLVLASYSVGVSLWFNCGEVFGFPGIDLALELWGLGRARPGFDKEYTIRYLNTKSSVANDVTLILTLPSQVTYLSSTPPGNVSGNVVTWNLGTVGGGIRSVIARVNVPISVPAGTNLTASASISITDPEEYYDNNSDSEIEIVIAYWDPHDKEAQPLGYFIAKDENLKYTIFFENIDTATAEAIYITVEDTLDPNLDWTTISVGPMSHPDKCFFSFNSTDGVISWFCDSIMLPPNVNPPEGEGFVSFSIKPDSGLAFGTQIKNRAYIQFDFNPWIAAPDSAPVIRTIGLYGDANSDGEVNVADVVYLVNYLFVEGPGPEPWQAGDTNCDGAVNVADVIFLVNYLFLDGPPPGC